MTATFTTISSATSFMRNTRQSDKANPLGRPQISVWVAIHLPCINHSRTVGGYLTGYGHLFKTHLHLFKQLGLSIQKMPNSAVQMAIHVPIYSKKKKSSTLEMLSNGFLARIVNPLSPNINMHILLTILRIFLILLVGRT